MVSRQESCDTKTIHGLYNTKPGRGIQTQEVRSNQNMNNMNELKVTLACGISVDFTGKLDEPYHFIGTFADMLSKHKTSKNPEIRNSAIIEIENRAINYAHKALAGYNMRAMMADEAVKLLMKKLSE